MAKKLAVVLSGGGAKGAFQAGALEELVVRRGADFDIWAGVSTGAIQALGGAMGDVPGLVAHWRTINSNKDIYTENASILGGLLGADSLHDTKPLQARLKAFADEAKLRASGKTLLLGVVNLQTGAFRTVDQRASNIADWVYASCAMPVYFKPLKTRDPASGQEDQWVDGGVRDVTPLSAAMEQNPDAILVIRASAPPANARKDKLYKNLISVGLRATGIQQSEVSKNDIENAELINALIAARAAQAKALAASGLPQAEIEKVLKPLDKTLADYRIVPVRVLEPAEDFADTLEFSKTAIAKSIDAGAKAAAKAWESGGLKGFLAG
jgi:NTE family protein